MLAVSSAEVLSAIVITHFSEIARLCQRWEVRVYSTVIKVQYVVEVTRELQADAAMQVCLHGIQATTVDMHMFASPARQRSRIWHCL